MSQTAYQESETHVPKATDQTGTLDTSGTAGANDSNLRKVTPVFDVAEEQDLAVAARALDPDDHDVHHSLVNLPQGAVIHHADPDAAAERVRSKAKAVTKKSRRSSSRESQSSSSSSSSSGGSSSS